MYRKLAVWGILLLLLNACQREEPARESGEARRSTSAPVTEPARPETAQSPAGAPQEPQTAVTPQAAEGQRQEMAAQPGTAASTAAREEQGEVEQSPAAGEEQAAAEPQLETAQKESEFYGQSPPFGNAPEVITFEAKNGNVTFGHKAHAERLDCSACHGQEQPGKFPEWNQNKAHQLCQGCHKEQGTGPTRCNECHKKG